jgi:hypothetical protein
MFALLQGGIHQIVIMTLSGLSGFCYLRQQLTYLVLGRILLIATVKLVNGVAPLAIFLNNTPSLFVGQIFICGDR